MSAIVLIGPMGAGKTSIGKRVARALGEGFTDTDAAIVAAHGPIEEIFAAHGEPHFRELEAAAVRGSLAAGGVVALGGGSVLHPDTRAALAGHRVVYLTVTPERVASRIRGSRRPLLAGDDPLVRWNEVFRSRRALYESLADLTVDTSTGPLQDAVDAIVDWARGGQA